MKIRQETRRRMVPHTIDGRTHEVPETYTVDAPALPKDWDAIAIRVAVGLVLALTGIAVVWSTRSIGMLLGGGVGLAVGALFDLSWLVNLILEWLSRFDEKRRQFPRAMGWGLLVVTVGAIFWEGWEAGSIPLAVVGASVSLVAKILWMGIMLHINRDVSGADAAWVEAETSRANAQLAVAGVRKMTAVSDARAAMELLAAERIRAQVEALRPTAAIAEADTTPVLEAAAIDVPTRSGQTLADAVAGTMAGGKRMRSGQATAREVSQGPAGQAYLAAVADGWTLDEIMATVRALDPTAAPLQADDVVGDVAEEPVSNRSQLTLRRAVRACRADLDNVPAGGSPEVSDEAFEAIRAAVANGWTLDEIRATARTFAPTVAPLQAEEPAQPRTQLTLRRAVRACVEDMEGVSADGSAEVSDEAFDAIRAAVEDGWTEPEVYGVAWSEMRRIGSRPSAVRADVRLEDAFDLVTKADPAGTFRADTRPDMDDDETRDGRGGKRPSLLSDVRRMVAEGTTDTAYIVRALAARHNRTADDPRYRATVARYVRDSKDKTPEPSAGFYP